jgi:hypothetical protein
MAGIHKSMFDAAVDARKEHALKPPIREKDEIFIPCSGALKHVSKIILLKQIRVHPAVFAGKQSVRFF